MLLEQESSTARSGALTAVTGREGRHVASYLTNPQAASVALYAAGAGLRPSDTAALGSRQLRAAIHDFPRP